MTTEERELSRLLQHAIPEPPHGIELDQARPLPPTRNSGWLPTLVAACVLVLVAVLGVLAVRGRDQHAVAPATSTPSSPRTGSAAPPVSLPWSATLLTTTAQPVRPVSLDGWLYIESKTGFSRLDPVTGEVLASTRLNIAWPPVLAGGKLWVAVRNTNAYEIDQLNPISLRMQSGISGMASGFGVAADPVLAVSADGSQVALGAGNNVHLYDGIRMAEVGEQTVAGPITAITFSPDGTKLFLGHGVRVATIGATNKLELLDDRTAPAGITGLAATPGGLWVVTSTGHSAAVSYAPAFDLDHLHPVATSSGTVLPAVAATGTVVFLSGATDLACADPRTGAIRVTTVLPDGVFIDGMASIAAGRLAVGYQSSGARTGFGVAYLTPPAVCG